MGTTDRLRSKSAELRSPGTKTDEEHEYEEHEDDESDQSKFKEESPNQKSRKSCKRMRIRKERRRTQSSVGSNDDNHDNISTDISKSIENRRLSNITQKDSGTDDSELSGKRFSEVQDIKALKEQRQAEERDLRTRKRLEERKKRIEQQEESDEEQYKEDIKEKGKGSSIKDKNKNNPKDAAKIQKMESKINETITEESKSTTKVDTEMKVIDSSDVDK